VIHVRDGIFGSAGPKLDWGILAVEIRQIRKTCHFGSDDVGDSRQ
jgi:hypothetical protein